jgi:uncharacterized protein (TIGR02996 family)
MDRLVAARKLIGELVKGEQIEVRRPEIVGRDLDRYCETLGRPPTGQELEVWLGEHAQVQELYASTSLLDELVYRHLTPPPPENVNDAVARNPALEREIREAGDTRDPYLVYADWLQEQGDPMGELVALGVKATEGGDEDLVRFERYRKLHEARFLADVPRDKVTLIWRNGVVEAIEESPLERMTLGQWEIVLRLRVCEFLREITFRRTPTAELEALVVEHAATSLRSLVLDGTALPRQIAQRPLRSLTLTGAKLVLDASTLPGTLERLVLRVDDLSVETSLLGIRELAMSVHAYSAARLAGLLESIPFPALVRLSISDGLLDAKTFGRLGRSEVGKQLTHLALTNLELTDELVQAMARAKTEWTLEELDLSFNELSKEGLATAKRLAKTVISRRQNKRGNGAEKRVRQFAGSRLTVAEEIAIPKLWKRAGVDGELRWGRYRSSVLVDYELFVTADLSRYGCSCPSSIQPCKHVVALALVAERTSLPQAPSDGIAERVARRRAEIEAEGFGDIME